MDKLNNKGFMIYINSDGRDIGILKNSGISDRDKLEYIYRLIDYTAGKYTVEDLEKDQSINVFFKEGIKAKFQQIDYNSERYNQRVNNLKTARLKAPYQKAIIKEITNITGIKKADISELYQELEQKHAITLNELKTMIIEIYNATNVKDIEELKTLLTVKIKQLQLQQKNI